MRGGHGGSSEWPTAWPRDARRIADATAAAIAAARDASPENFGTGVEELAELPFEQVTIVHAGVVRALLEDLHPDGLAGDDIHDVLTRLVGSASAWLPGLDVGALAAVLTGALGFTDTSDDAQKVGHVGYLRSAVLVMADLLAAADTVPDRYIRAAIGEIARAETVEMP